MPTMRLSCELGVCGLVSEGRLIAALVEVEEEHGYSGLDIVAEWVDEGIELDLEALLIRVWLGSDGSSYTNHFDNEDIVALFRQAGFVTDTTMIEPPSAPMTVYRGCDPAFILRPSWSRSRSVAAWYADLERGGHIYAAEISPDDVLAILLTNRSREIVVDPDGLRNIREVRRPQALVLIEDVYDERRELRAIGINVPALHIRSLDQRLKVLPRR